MAELIILNRNFSDSKPDSLFFILLIIFRGFPGGSVVKNPPAMQKLQVGSLCWEDPMEEEMATHSTILARIIPWTEEPGRLQSTGSQRAGHDWSKRLHTHTIQSFSYFLLYFCILNNKKWLNNHRFDLFTKRGQQHIGKNIQAAVQELTTRYCLGHSFQNNC